MSLNTPHGPWTNHGLQTITVPEPWQTRTVPPFPCVSHTLITGTGIKLYSIVVKHPTSLIKTVLWPHETSVSWCVSICDLVRLRSYYQFYWNKAGHRIESLHITTNKCLYSRTCSNRRPNVRRRIHRAPTAWAGKACQTNIRGRGRGGEDMWCQPMRTHPERTHTHTHGGGWLTSMPCLHYTPLLCNFRVKNCFWKVGQSRNLVRSETSWLRRLRRSKYLWWESTEASSGSCDLRSEGWFGPLRSKLQGRYQHLYGKQTSDGGVMTGSWNGSLAPPRHVLGKGPSPTVSDVRDI